MEKLTNREREILDMISRLRQVQGYPPTLQEIGDAVGIGTRAGVHRHLGALEKKGYLDRGAGRRSLKLLRDMLGRRVPTSEETVSIPRHDRVRGGPFDLARTDVEEFISVPRDWLRGGEGFAVQVIGDSMFPNLMDGDLAIVRSRAVAQNGDIVVALLGDEATIKRFQRLQDRVLLIPDNSDYKTLEFTSGQEIRILGKVVRSVRSFD